MYGFMALCECGSCIQRFAVYFAIVANIKTDYGLSYVNGGVYASCGAY